MVRLSAGTWHGQRQIMGKQQMEDWSDVTLMLILLPVVCMLGVPRAGLPVGCVCGRTRGHR
jgi:hypothetical protein